MNRTVKRTVTLLLTATVGLGLLAGGAEAKPAANKGVEVKVMTRNLFLGADLGPALNATSFQEFTAANGAILREVDATDFPRRAVGLAKEIRQRKPDLVGLQEGAWWRTGPEPTVENPYAQGPNGNFTATTNRYDFVALLLERLNANTTRRYKGYEVAVAGTEFDFEAPADFDSDPNTGLLGGEVMGRLTMRDAILVRKGGAVKTRNPQAANFVSLFTPNVSGIDVPVTRGYVSVDATATAGKGRDKVKRRFRFVDSHFEAFDDETQVPSIRALQAGELLAGPASKKRTIILGDFNSDVPGLKPGDQQAYQVLLDGGFSERATNERTSCCVSSVLGAPPSEFDHRVDHVMTNMGKKVKLIASEITGKQPVNGIYDSDHAGIFSELLIK